MDIRTILYVKSRSNNAEIYTSGGKVYRVHITLENLEKKLGDGFIKPHRSRLVSVMAIHDITDKINLNNGERIDYVARRKKELIAQLQEKRARLIGDLGQSQPGAEDGLQEYYRCFDAWPIAFAEIEMVLDEGNNATEAAFAVGYESLSQFTRDYHKMFGRSPSEDLLFLRSAPQKQANF